MKPRFYPNIIPTLYNHIPDKEMDTLKGMVIHAMSEFIHRDSLKYNYKYNKSNETFLGKKIEDYPEWLDCEHYLYLVGLSANFLIYPNGDLKILKDAKYITFHAGESEFKDLKNLNTSFCGVEVLVEGKNLYGDFINIIENKKWVNDRQYDTLNYLIDYISKEHESFQYVIGHEKCSGDHVRGKGKGKKDPNKHFDWSMVNWKNK